MREKERGGRVREREEERIGEGGGERARERGKEGGKVRYIEGCRVGKKRERESGRERKYDLERCGKDWLKGLMNSGKWDRDEKIW